MSAQPRQRPTIPVASVLVGPIRAVDLLAPSCAARPPPRMGLPATLVCPIFDAGDGGMLYPLINQPRIRTGPAHHFRGIGYLCQDSSGSRSPADVTAGIAGPVWCV